MKKIRFIFFLYLAFFFNTTSYSQEPVYEHFGVDEGLPSSQVYDIYQTKDGYVWFATDKGLSRYNGYEFKNFDTNDELPGNVVLKFYPQKDGKIWAYSLHARALFYFNEHFSGFTKYKHNKVINEQLIPTSVVKSIFFNEDNTLKLGGTHINGLLSIKDNGEIIKDFENEKYFDKVHPKRYLAINEPFKDEVLFFTTLDKKNINKVFSIKRVNETFGHLDVIWLEKGKKAVFMDASTIEVIDSKKESIEIKTGKTAIGIKAIDNFHFFAGYYFGGAKIINDRGEILKEYLKEKSVTNFLIDHEGGYWFTTLYSGIYYVKNPLINILKASIKKSSTHIKSLAKRKNELLIGYKNGDYAELQPNNTLKFIKSIGGFGATLVEYDAIFNKTYLYNSNQIKINKKPADSLYSLKLSEPSLDGTVFSSSPAGYRNVTKHTLHSLHKRILDVSKNKKGLLFATPFGVFEKNKDAIRSLSYKSKLFTYRSDDIDISKKGNTFFIATQGAGVVVYGNKIYNISKRDGLTSNIVNEILVENDSTIYACTNKGLNRIVFNDTGFIISKIDKNSGLLSNEVEDVEVLNDILWVATKDGLCYFPKKVLENKHLDYVYLKLKEIKVKDVIYNSKEHLNLNYDDNKITFFVEGISFANNYSLEYRYRLKEIDQKWSSTQNRNITFPSLAYGKYTFQVKACNNINCFEDDLLEYSFTIKPPFWKSWWFYILCFLSSCGLIYLFFRIRVLTYNKDIVREFFRLLIKKLKSDEKYLEIKMNGETIKIATKNILFIKSSGNYLDIVCIEKTYTIRCKIGDFIASTPDTLEYLRVHRSYIIRIDKVTVKSKKTITIKEHTIPVGEKYLEQLNHIHF